MLSARMKLCADVSIDAIDASVRALKVAGSPCGAAVISRLASGGSCSTMGCRGYEQPRVAADRPAKCCGGGSRMLAKQRGEVALARAADLERNLGDAQLPAPQ